MYWNEARRCWTDRGQATLFQNKHGLEGIVPNEIGEARRVDFDEEDIRYMMGSDTVASVIELRG